MKNEFKENEFLYRAVWPNVFKKKNRNAFSTALFKCKGGCSVDRGDFRDDEIVVECMLNHNLHGGFVKVSVGDCIAVDTKPCYLPSADNIYHSEIHGNNTIELSDEQRFDLGMKAIIIKYPK